MRARITAALAALALVALTAAGLIVYVIERARIDEAVSRQIEQEIAEFEKLRDGKDPATNEPFTNVEALLRLYLSRNVPSDEELLMGWLDNGHRLVSSDDALARSPAFIAAVRRLLDTGGTERITSDGQEHLFTVLPVRNRQTSGALVVSINLDEVHQELNTTMRTYTIVAALSLGLIAALAFWQSGRLLAPLRTLRDTTNEIKATDLSQRIPVTGNDDLTALSVTFNDMLDRLEASFTTQREFLDDAGHELKTPITVLRGHLELLDQGSPEEVEETRVLLLDEVDRMARLVNDLILLAKSNRPDFLARDAVSLERLTETVLAKARGLGERGWESDGTGAGTVVVDEQRLTQALLALADNAVKHTRDGDVVAIGSSYDVHAVRLWVRDSGDGVPAADREVIFERFGRSRVRAGDEGFGLGLSIVRAIAEAHGGTVHVEDAMPRGSRFVITLPTGAPNGQKHGEDRWPAS